VPDQFPGRQKNRNIKEWSLCITAIQTSLTSHGHTSYPPLPSLHFPAPTEYIFTYAVQELVLVGAVRKKYNHITTNYRPRHSPLRACYFSNFDSTKITIELEKISEVQDSQLAALESFIEENHETIS